MGRFNATRTQAAFVGYALADEAYVPGRWVPVDCYAYEDALNEHGGLIRLNVYSSATDQESEARFTEWGLPGGKHPVGAQVYQPPLAGEGAQCYHLRYETETTT
jgi:hypothetical protein